MKKNILVLIPIKQELTNRIIALHEARIQYPFPYKSVLCSTIYAQKNCSKISRVKQGGSPMKKKKVLPSPKDCLLICPVFFPLPDIHQKKNKVALCFVPHIKEIGTKKQHLQYCCSFVSVKR
jgi:hypothetical protein